jgi:hypothetical protein
MNKPALKFYGDSDGDGVMNGFDCAPNNKFKQGPEHKKYPVASRKQKGESQTLYLDRMRKIKLDKEEAEPPAYDKHYRSMIRQHGKKYADKIYGNVDPDSEIAKEVWKEKRQDAAKREHIKSTQTKDEAGQEYEHKRKEIIGIFRDGKHVVNRQTIKQFQKEQHQKGYDTNILALESLDTKNDSQSRPSIKEQERRIKEFYNNLTSKERRELRESQYVEDIDRRAQSDED